MDNNIHDLIKSVRNRLSGLCFDGDASLCVYILGDTDIVKADHDLYSLAWALSQDRGTTRHEAEWFISLVEQAIKEQESK